MKNTKFNISRFWLVLLFIVLVLISLGAYQHYKSTYSFVSKFYSSGDDYVRKKNLEKKELEPYLKLLKDEYSSVNNIYAGYEYYPIVSVLALNDSSGIMIPNKYLVFGVVLLETDDGYVGIREYYSQPGYSSSYDVVRCESIEDIAHLYTFNNYELKPNRPEPNSAPQSRKDQLLND